MRVQGLSLVSAICSMMLALGIMYGSKHLVQSHTYVLNNMQSVFLLLFSAIMCKPPSRLELAGLACVIFGGAAMMLDPQAVRTDGASGGLLTYTVVFFSSAFAALYFIVNGYNLKSAPPITLLFTNALYVWVFSALLGRVLDSRVEIFSNSPVWGCLGFMN